MSIPPTVAAGIKAMLGTPSDWLPQRPTRVTRRVGMHLLGPTMILISLVPLVLAVDGAGSSSFGFVVGLASIVLMAWSFVLSVRVRILEPFFGGLDRAYIAHRWCGVLAIGAMYLHTSFEPEGAGGVPGARASVAEMAEELAGTGQTMLYILVGLSVLRWMPYRWWRWSHKLLGLPFLMAGWHTWTATKPFANGSAWCSYIATVIVIGIVSWIVRVIGRDVLFPGRRYRVAGAVRSGSTTELTLTPVGRPIRFTAGQFAVLKLSVPGMREPHIFTIASDPGDRDLRFCIRDLGDWTARLQEQDLLGADVAVEGPYGRLSPLPRRGITHETPAIWVAGGVGVTPFLAAASSVDPMPSGHRPVLLYCVRSADGATGIAELRRAQSEGRIDLVVISSAEGQRFSVEQLARLGDLRKAHIAACGPQGLISEVVTAARACGAAQVDSESFDIRAGLGPDLSRELDSLGRDVARRFSGAIGRHR